MSQQEIIEIDTDDLFCIFGTFELAQWADSQITLDPVGDLNNYNDGVAGSVGRATNASGYHAEVTLSIMQGSSSDDYLDTVYQINESLPLIIRHLSLNKKYVSPSASIMSHPSQEFNDEVDGNEWVLRANRILPAIPL